MATNLTHGQKRANAIAKHATPAKLDTLAAILTTRTGTKHSVYRTPRGTAVYADTMAVSLGYTLA